RSVLVNQLAVLLQDPAGVIRMFERAAESYKQEVNIYSDANTPSRLNGNGITLKFEGPKSGQLRVMVSWTPEVPESFQIEALKQAVMSGDSGGSDESTASAPPPPGNCLTCVGTTAWECDSVVTLQLHTICLSLWFPPA